MPTLHIANLTVTLVNDNGRWSAVVSPDSNSHWYERESSWEYRLAYEEYGDSVEIRIPAEIVHDGCTFELVAESQPPSGPAVTWSASNGSLCSPPFAAVLAFYFDVEATPIGTPLPLGLPTGVCPRGGGHYHVKNAGGDGDPRR